MAKNKTQAPQKIYEKIVAKLPGFASGTPKLSDLVADDPVMQICQAGPEVFDYWLKKVPSHAGSLKDKYEASALNQVALAQAGAAVWNYWQRTEEGTRITSDSWKYFLAAGIIDFSGFHFLKKVGFSKEISYSDLLFSGVTFSEEVDVSGVTFSKEVNFSGVTFSEGVNFSGVTFSRKADFEGAIFSRKADFEGAIFSRKASFQDVVFSDEADFEGVKFSQAARFSGVEFSQLVSFQKAVFSEYTSFSSVIFSAEANLRSVKFSYIADFSEVEFALTADFDGVIFSGDAHFAESRFEDYISFRDAKFESLTDFTGCKFDGGPPICHGASIHQDTRFLGAEWPTTQALNYERPPYTRKEDLLAEWKSSYRTLKLAFAQYQSVREEQEFGRLEMEMDRHLMRHLKKWGQAAYLTLYGKLADYGYSAKRPTLWLLGLFAVGCCVAFWAKDCSVSEALKLSLAYTLPPFVLAAKFPDTGYWFVWFAPQRLLSYLFWFLIVLAWRNRAKSK